MIDVADLVRRRGGRAVVDGVSFTVEAGEIVGLIGLNGAGKTSLIDCIAGLARPDAGLVSVAGHVPGSLAARRATGVLLQQPGLPARLTVAETLALFAGLHEVAVDTRLAAALGLDALAGCRVDRLSGGQEQRLALALAFQSGAPALVLDEPATALDPLMRRDLAALLGERRAAGAAILLATHDLAEAVALSDRILVMSERPGTMIEEIVVDIPDRDNPMQRRKHPKLADYVSRLMELLKLDAHTHMH
jgi:ABC-type multidrug transport system ATPase subunit